MKTFRAQVFCKWYDGNKVIHSTSRIYKVSAKDKYDAEIKVEDKAARDSNFNYGKPDEVDVLEIF